MTASSHQDRVGYWRDRDWVTGAMHELPIGVLYGAVAESAVRAQQ